MTMTLARPAPLPFREGLPPHEVVAGMPQLGLHGLSEQWLLKECGHRHWLMLADLFGLPRPEFRDRDGNTLYATFTGLSLCDAHPERVAEHDTLRFDGRIRRVTRTRFQSEQCITAGGVPVARMAMVSAFLRRAVPGDNHSVERALPLRAAVEAPGPPAADSLAGLTHRFGRGRWEEHGGFRRSDRRRLDAVRITPCPHSEFNGAGFLYFASFQGFVDRAEWALFPDLSAGLVTAARDLFFYGNINPGDTLSVGLCGVRDGEDGRSHWFEIRRGCDDALIADAFTRRRPCCGAGGAR
ncbi:Pnap_2097 family protein [Azospirillum halopraeferens]|uniref:Pnap_2097 family protein n=1 Tax=Azospirillum halopraeferens TaxID=34010 RepID=UPI0004214121|nr:Pnap_2097 family protein [Azospirillum halopraeferens]